MKAHLVPVANSRFQVWSHGPFARLPKLEDHCHAVLYMEVDVTVNNPGARVVKRCSEDDIAVRWNLYGVFENRVVKVAWQTRFSLGT